MMYDPLSVICELFPKTALVAADAPAAVKLLKVIVEALLLTRAPIHTTLVASDAKSLTAKA